MAQTRSLHHGRFRPITLILLIGAALCASAGPVPGQDPGVHAWKKPPAALDERYAILLASIEAYRVYDYARLLDLSDLLEALETADMDGLHALIRRVPLEMGPISQMALVDLALVALRQDRSYVANAHLALAEFWINDNLARKSDGGVARERQVRFARDWFLAAIWIRFGRAEEKEAGRLLEQARLKFPDDPEVLLSSGTYYDIQVLQLRVARQLKLLNSPFGMPSSPTSDPMTGLRMPGRLSQEVRAQTFYREAIRLDPNMAEARIRLAYLLLITQAKPPDEALTLLKEARALTDQPPLSYLAALFAGDAEERAKHLEAAARWFRTAIAECPHAQTARLALSHVQLDLNESQLRAQNSLRPLMGGPPPEDGLCEPDGWRIYEFGQHWRLTPWILAMRKQVREPVEKSEP